MKARGPALRASFPPEEPDSLPSLFFYSMDGGGWKKGRVRTGTRGKEVILKWTVDRKESKVSASEWIENQGRNKVRHFSAAPRHPELLGISLRVRIKGRAPP